MNLNEMGNELLHFEKSIMLTRMKVNGKFLW